MDDYFLFNLLKIPEFDYNYLLYILRDYNAPRDQITKLIRIGTIVRVKKGLYVLGPLFKRPFSRYVLSNLIYGPSYVCGYTALSFFGAIPERVDLWQAKTPNRKKLFHTPVGNFGYSYTHLKKYKVSIQLESIDHLRNFLISSPEKTVLEIMENEKEIINAGDLYDWFKSLRMDLLFLKKLRLKYLYSLRQVFRTDKTDLLIKVIREIKNRKGY